MYLKFEKKVLEYCTQHKMFTDGAVLIALSGGGDSVALLHILVKICDNLGIAVEAAHLNHSLRDEESDNDENFCRDLCKDLKIPLTIERLIVGEIYQNQGSIETAAREARLAFLKRVAVKRNATRIATGHTLDDLAETVLQRIMRGTGPAGLSGILPVREGIWVRPILCLSREDVRNYLSEKGIEFREDLTNQDTIFFRNRVRHELIPLLKERFSPNIINILGRLAELSRIQEEYLDERIQEAYRECIIHEDDFKILLDKSKLMDYNVLLRQRIVRHCLKVLEGAGRDADMEEVENILNLFVNNHGITDITSKVICEVEERFVVFTSNVKPFNPLPVELSGETVIPMGGGRIIGDEVSEWIRVDGKVSIIVNPDIIEKFGALTVGVVKPGDSIKPFGMDGAVKVRDIFSSASIPKTLRNYVPVVRAGAVPVWIPGLRSSECLRFNTNNNGYDTFMIFTFKDGIKWCYLNENIKHVDKKEYDVL